MHACAQPRGIRNEVNERWGHLVGRPVRWHHHPYYINLRKRSARMHSRTYNLYIHAATSHATSHDHASTRAHAFLPRRDWLCVATGRIEKIANGGSDLSHSLSPILFPGFSPLQKDSVLARESLNSADKPETEIRGNRQRAGVSAACESYFQRSPTLRRHESICTSQQARL